ncbi:TPA: heme-binding protein [Vibrio cholerae]
MKINNVKIFKACIISGLLALPFTAMANSNASYTPPVLTYEMAEKAAKSAFQAALEESKSVTVSVVDRSGQLMTSIRHHNAGIHTLQASYKKAYTANSMKQPTAVIAKNIRDGKAPEDLKYLDNNILLLDGGVPLIVDGVVVGGIGVGGAQGHEDVKYAKKGAGSISH